MAKGRIGEKLYKSWRLQLEKKDVGMTIYIPK
jgi:hypothetical protein